VRTSGPDSEPTTAAPMADLLPLAELQFRIALLPPISRGAHLGGPVLHAQRLTKLWEVAAGDDIPLAEAFRLLDEAAVEGAIWRALATGEYFGAQYWSFPDIGALLPELRELCWQAMVEGTLLVEALGSKRARRPRVVLPAELQRLTPNWQLSQLCRGRRRAHRRSCKAATGRANQKGMAQGAEQGGDPGRYGSGRSGLPTRRTASLPGGLARAQAPPSGPPASIRTASVSRLRSPTTRAPRLSRRQITGVNRRHFLVGDLAISARLVLIRHDSVTPLSKGSRQCQTNLKT
jgi:hypothetical protein